MRESHPDRIARLVRMQKALLFITFVTAVIVWRRPDLALTVCLGFFAIHLLFAGILGYLIWQNRKG